MRADVRAIFLGWFLATALIAFVLFGLDKRRARDGRRRVRESTLISWALLGGSLGLIVGLFAFHHKVSKPSFLLKLLAVVTLQLGVAYAWARGWRV